jgi:hypothetical protein
MKKIVLLIACQFLLVSQKSALTNSLFSNRAGTFSILIINLFAWIISLPLFQVPNRLSLLISGFFRS